MFPLQHPFGHEVASHTHCPVPVVHRWPVAHAPHAAPRLPHDAVDCDAYASHRPVAPPAQHPLGQLCASHSQSPVAVSHRPFEHGAHARPEKPQATADCDA